MIATITLSSSALAEDRVIVSVQYVEGYKELVAVYPTISTCQFIVSNMKYTNVKCESHSNDEVTYGGVKVNDKTFLANMILDYKDNQTSRKVAKYTSFDGCATDATRFNTHSKSGNFAWCQKIKSEPDPDLWNRTHNK